MSFLLDYQQLRISVPGATPAYFYDLPTIAPQTEFGLAFTLPPLTPGFHQLSILLSTDPTTTTTNMEYRFAQRRILAQYDIDLWVDTPPFQPEVPYFDDPEVGWAATSRVNVAGVVENPLDFEERPVLSMNLRPGATTCVNLDLFNGWAEVHAAYTGTVPLRVGVFWNDQLTEVLDYGLVAEKPNVYLPLNIHTPTDPGTYQLGFVVFVFPGYSRFKEFGPPTMFAQSAFSQRMVVNVQP